MTADGVGTPAPPQSATMSALVEWSDTGAAGHHHNSSVMRWVEACEVGVYRQLGLLAHFPNMPRVQQVVNYTAKLWFGQQVTTAIRLYAVGRTSITFEFEVYGEEFDGGGRTRAAHGTFTSVHVAPSATSATPWPDSILTLVDPQRRCPTTV
ncbi:acyl-CoA thioesterase [Rhodococcus opacus]|nr:acyl-CoA thioesterase [Rhodococcus opacus]